MTAPRIKGGIAADGPFWDALEDGVFKLSRCELCHTWIWPAHYRCAACGSWAVGWATLAPVGAIYTWSRVFYTPGEVRERAADVPYVAILVEIPAAAGARVSGVLIGDETGLRIGAPVRGVFLPPAPNAKGFATIAWEIVR